MTDPPLCYRMLKIDRFCLLHIVGATDQNIAEVRKFRPVVLEYAAPTVRNGITLFNRVRECVDIKLFLKNPLKGCLSALTEPNPSPRPPPALLLMYCPPCVQTALGAQFYFGVPVGSTSSCRSRLLGCAKWSSHGKYL
jgi:hypothetical protein